QLNVGYGNALDFDGVDDYVSIPAINLNAYNTMSIEAWVKPGDISTNPYYEIIRQEGVEWPDWLLAFQEHGQILSFGLFTDGSYQELDVDITPTDYTDGQWHHIAATYDGQTQRLYRDGDEIGRKSKTGHIRFSADAVHAIGACRGKSEFFEGQIGQVCLWNVARTPEDIRQDKSNYLTGDESGLAACWSLDEGTGDRIQDSASKNHGQFHAGSGGNLEPKWVKGPLPADVGTKWVACDNPHEKWVARAPIAVLDYGLSRQGTLAMLPDQSVVSLGLKGDDGPVDLSVPRFQAEADQMAKPMGVVHRDKQGLSVCAGLLELARCGDTPYLLDGADGLIHLYFRGDQSQFLVAQYDTLTARAEYALPLGASDGGPQLRFIARQPGSHMNDYTIKIEEATEQTCRVTLNGPDGVNETWQNVPRELEQFLAVLNGTATADANDPLVEKRKLVLYDYNNKQNVQRQGVPDLTSGDIPFFGSTLFGVGVDNLPEPGQALQVQSGKVTQAQPSGKDCAWVSEKQGKALKFDGDNDYVRLPPHLLDIPGDLTMEAWVKVAPGDHNNMRLVNYHTQELRFTLGLNRAEKGEGYQVVAGNGDKAIQAVGALVPPDEWTHLAAVYDATTALKLDGQGYVDCGNDVTLDMGEAMTIEAWVTPAMPTGQRQPEVILSKWGSNPAEQSWRLYIDPDGKPCFETQNDNNKLTSVKADLPLEAGQAYHLAAIFDATSEKVCALDLTGKSPDLVRIANSDRLQIEGAITIEAWIKVNAENIDELKNRDIQNIVARDHDPDGKEAVFLRTFQGKYQIGSWKGDGTGDRLAEFAIPQEDINTWVHLAGVYDDQEQAWVLYRNGVEVNRKPATVGALSAIYVPWTIGAAGWGNFPRTFKGQINNVRLWDCALSVEDIVKNMDKPATEIEGAVGNWEVDQADYSSKSRVSNKCDQTGEIAKRTDGTLEGAARIVKDLPKSNYRQKILVGQGGAQETQESWLKVPEKELNPTNTKVNLGRSASEEDYFRGIIDEVRLWQVNRYDGQIHYYRDRPPGNAEGLVSNWRFEEGRGKTASDVKGSNHGRLVHPEAEQIPAMWISSARNARFILYVNGQVATGEEIKLADHGHYGLNNRFTIGAMIDEDETVQPEADKPLQNMAGCIDEVRLWDTVRTPEQLRDNMYRALFGGEEGLVGYWPLDEGEKTTVYDQTGNGQHGTVKEEQWIDSTAPIGNEGPEVKNVYGGQPKPGFNRRIIGPPAAVEYGDMQWDAEGNLFGVMKRGYIFQEEAIQLVTGFKVGDLELHFIGQVQTAPTLIGYIEGAPPVPSENLTVNDPEEDDYVGTSSIQLTEAKETIQLYSASRDLGLDFSWDFKRGFYWAANVEVEYSFVTGSVGGDVFSTEGKVGTHSYFESSAAQLSGATITAGTSKTLTKSLALCGGWEEPQDYDQTGQTRYLNPEVGQRYLPNNMGYALVKSATADLFALRLKSTGSLVAFQVVPNPDIPEDWNIIMFPLNPKYVKNGTLDGMVGLVPDPDYPGAIAGERGSYFKPLEAYALKERIERDAEKLESYYANFTPAAKLLSSGEGRLLDELPETTLGYDWQTGRDRRSMVNTYVWTADGGFYAEEEQFSSIRQESLGGSYHYLEREGVFTDITLAAAGVGFCLEEDALFGSHLNVTVGKSKEDKAAFGLQVEVQGEGYLFEKGEWNEKTQKFNYTSHACPGKVDGYRFMTFYLAPRSNNFDEFFEDVVDPEWLKGQGKYGGDYSPNARALREAQARPNEVWRVLHRVTYVSRIPPQFERTPAEVVPKDVHRPDNIEANGGLIQEIEQLAPPQPSLIELGVAVDKLLGQPPVSGDDGWSPGELEGIIPWWTKVKSEAKKEIRRDVIEY
ncbi:MAG: LamG domain-containing protein, partial [Anaerolineae bacterium]|nr:LamG domain-containing protein [Anaerolineae bacterium]